MLHKKICIYWFVSVVKKSILLVYGSDIVCQNKRKEFLFPHMTA